MLRKSIYYLTHWEVWHWFVKYIIIGPVWLWLCIKSRSFWFFTPSNPAITFGGFLGETKRESYKLLPEGSYPKSIFISPRTDYRHVKSQVASSGFRFPFAVKPDIGMMGFMFRKIESYEQLHQYHAAMKANYIVQELADFPLEVSVFYYRFPGKARGHITGFVKKEPMTVTGDGKSSLRQLILSYPRARFRTKELFGKHKSKLDEILDKGQRFVLSDALNLSRGGHLVDLGYAIDDRLLAVFDNLSHRANFLYGRYDIKCASVEDLRQGKNYSILEYNGCGGEAHHVYDGRHSFFKACGILIDHWKILYRISAENRTNGLPPWSFMLGLLFLRRAKVYFKELKKLDRSFSFTTAARARVSSNTIEPLPALNMRGNQFQQRVA